MGRKKLQRFREIKTLNRYFEPLTAPKQAWKSRYFRSSHPLILELGCGYGEYTLGLAQTYPHWNVVGIDAKAARMYVGVRKADQSRLNNVAFLRIFVQFLPDYFTENEVDELWITFPDPFLKQRKHRRRLTSAYFLDVYRKVVVHGGKVHLKTDNDLLFDYTLEVLKEQEKEGRLAIDFYSNNIYAEPDLEPVWTIKTNYEKRYLSQGISIKGITFRLFK